MKAKKKPIQKYTPGDLGVDLTPLLETVKVTEPAKRVGGGKVGAFTSLCPGLQLMSITGGERRRALC
jgi:electron transfer flavoprotein beta subunit